MQWLWSMQREIGHTYSLLSVSHFPTAIIIPNNRTTTQPKMASPHNYHPLLLESSSWIIPRNIPFHCILSVTVDGKNQRVIVKLKNLWSASARKSRKALKRNQIPIQFYEMSQDNFNKYLIQSKAIGAEIRLSKKQTKKSNWFWKLQCKNRKHCKYFAGQQSLWKQKQIIFHINDIPTSGKT